MTATEDKRNKDVRDMIERDMTPDENNRLRAAVVRAATAMAELEWAEQQLRDEPDAAANKEAVARLQRDQVESVRAVQSVIREARERLGLEILSGPAEDMGHA